MSERVTVVGDALLDRDVCGHAQRLCPDAPVPVVDRPATVARPGGAGLAALLAARDGADVTLVCPIADDPAGAELIRLVHRAGVTVVPLAYDGATGEKVRVRADGHSIVRLDYGGQGAVGALTDGARSAIDQADSVLVSDYGRGVTHEPSVRAFLTAKARRVPIVWDPHPRGAQPVPAVRLATPNRSEASALMGHALDSITELTTAGRTLLERWDAAGVAITRGDRGVLLVSADGTPLAVPAPPARGGDPCGAGDRFAAGVTVALARGGLLSEAVVDAVAGAAEFVAVGGADALSSDGGRTTGHSDPDPSDLLRSVRSREGTVVATGGCFDLLHAGHVRMLEAARALGDCLVVCMNSDSSVRRLKGPGRPLVPQQDRRAVLSGLACVDAVVIFDEDTPERLLTKLRPDVWAKGADYAVADLPEAQLLATWNGQAVVLPYLDGHSTTRLLEEATRHARS